MAVIKRQEVIQNAKDLFKFAGKKNDWKWPRDFRKMSYR